MNDITGHPELTPYRGGWAGNDYPATLTTDATFEKMVLMLVATPGMIAPAATATNPAINAYSIRS